MKYITTLLFFMGSIASFAQENTQSLDQRIDQSFANATDWYTNAILYEIPITQNISIPWVLIILVCGALYFSFYFRGINFRGFFTAINVVRGKYDHVDKSDESDNDNGEVSHFQALTAALSATVGLGNIAGVAIALSIGGPGATFWMIVVGLLGMASKFVECTLGVKYREIDSDGTVFGGPMYYLRNGLKELGIGKIGRVLSILFAIMCVGGSFGGGNMFQVNQAFKLFEYVTGGEESFIYGQGWIFGTVMAIFAGIVIIGGIKKIAKVTDKVVPVMVVVYVLAVLTILGMNFSQIPAAFEAIIQGAFNPEGIAGGLVGVMIQGFRRGAFSNEAGIGSSSIAHSAVKTNYAASEGLVALLEPFIDTVVVCTMTALALIITGQITAGNAVTFEQGAILTSKALESGISWFPYVLTVAVILFAFSSMISWSYYGYQSWSYLFGRKKRTGNIYKVIFCLFTIIGAAATLNSVVDFSDAMVFAMMVPNMIGLVLLAPKVIKELRRYKSAIQNKLS
ncbi:alanine/glycine:cation symporter family protein [Pseudotenacibaculum haliotis]|uniref:Alanine/glycine:cation symporter family protein n=1 Tax=Pseudotenacibaculum haliotis TaxID=1862138 RepID=A0ABW5LQV3_9FLAO